MSASRSASTRSTATARAAARTRAPWRGGGRRLRARRFLPKHGALPPPLWGRVGVGGGAGKHLWCPVAPPPPPTPPHKGPTRGRGEDESVARRAACARL